MDQLNILTEACLEHRQTKEICFMGFELVKTVLGLFCFSIGSKMIARNL